ncbi:hypothetical protein STEG23_004899 [Scotinomys teguina]
MSLVKFQKNHENKKDVHHQRTEKELQFSNATLYPKVSTEEGTNLAREYNCAFFETSAALRFGIDDAFQGLVREIRRKESMLSLMEKKLKRKDSLWKKIKGSLKKKRENMT